MALALANEQLVFAALDIVDGQPEAFAEAQPATVDELEGSAIAAQADVGQEVMDLLAGEHGGQGVVIFGLDLGKEGPIGVAEEIDEEQVGGGPRLADGLGGPLLLEFDEQEVVPQLRLGDGLRVAADVLVDEPELAVVGVPGSIGVVAQSQVLGKPGHRGIRMLIIDGIDVVAGGGPNGGQGLVGPGVRIGDGVVVLVCVR